MIEEYTRLEIIIDLDYTILEIRIDWRLHQIGDYNRLEITPDWRL